MANKKSSSKKSNGVAAAVAVLVLLLAVAYFITALALGIRAGAPVWNPLKWGKTAEAATPSDNDGAENEDFELTPGGYSAIDEDGNLMREGVIYSMPSSLTFIGDSTITPTSKSAARAALTADSLQIGQSVTITATVLPENATNKRVTWSSDNQYVKVTPLAEGSNVATVTLTDYSESVFSESWATITCTSVSNPEATAFCKVSRLATKNEVEIEVYTEGWGDTLTYHTPAYGIEIITNLQKRGGGPSPLAFGDLANVGYSITCYTSDRSFMERVEYYLGDEFYDASYDTDGNIYKTDLTPWDLFYAYGNKADFNNAFMNAAKDYYGSLVVPIYIWASGDYIYNGVNCGTVWSDNFTVYLDLTELWVEVTGLEVDTDSGIITT